MPEPLAYRAYQFLWHSLDWIYPPTCAGCGQAGKNWCDQCDDGVKLIGPQLCPICGVPQSGIQVCLDCKTIQPGYKALRSWGVFKDKLRTAIHRLKYRRNVALGQALAVPMIQELQCLNWPIDIVVPVPLGLARLAERGYNQASLLARPIALFFQYSYHSTAIRRTRETPTQVGMSFASRSENVSGAFFANSSIVKGKNVLIIDDVITSGSTMNSCATALLEADASEVYGFSLARAGVNDPQGSDNILPG